MKSKGLETSSTSTAFTGGSDDFDFEHLTPDQQKDNNKYNKYKYNYIYKYKYKDKDNDKDKEETSSTSTAFIGGSDEIRPRLPRPLLIVNV